MDITITLSGIQENSKYILEFSLNRDGVIVNTNTSTYSNKPSLDKIENDKPIMSSPAIDDNGVKKSYKDFKTSTNIDPKSL